MASIHIESGEGAQPPVWLTPADTSTIDALWPLDKSVYRFCPVPDQFHFHDAKQFLTNFDRQNVWQIHTVVGRGTLKLVGVVGLSDIDSDFPSVSTYLMSPDQRARGVGTRAKIGVGAYYAADAGLLRIRARTLQTNTAAKLSLARSGFVRLPDAVDDFGRRPEVRYGDEKDRATSYWTDWTMILPHGNEPPFVLSEQEQEAARAHFADVQAAHRVTIAVA